MTRDNNLIRQGLTVSCWWCAVLSAVTCAGTTAILHSSTLAQLTKRMSLARKNEEAAANQQESEEAAANLQETKEFKESKECKEWRECNKLYYRCNAYHRCVESRFFLELLVPSFITCPISPLSLARFCPSSKVMSVSSSHHPLQCTRPIGPVKRNNYETTS